MTGLDLEVVAARIERPDDEARRLAREGLDRLVRPPGGLGRLGELAVLLAGAHGQAVPRPLDAVRVLVLAADHGVAAAGVSAWPAAATEDLAARIVAGAAPVSIAAALAGVPVRVHDVGMDRALDENATTTRRVRGPSGRVDRDDAMTRAEAERAVQTGLDLVDDEVDAGADLLVLAEIGVAATTPAAALVGLLTSSDASQVTGRGSGIDDATWMRKCAAVRDAMRRGRAHLGDQLDLLATAGGVDTAVATGVLLGAAARRTPVVLDGVVGAAAGLVAQRIAFRAVDWWVAAHRTREPAQQLALDRLSLEPVLDLGIDAGEGVGALAVVPLLQSASRLLAEVAELVPPPEQAAADGEEQDEVSSQPTE